MPLSPDLPSTDPKEDLFGHAPFAEQLAKSISRLRSEAGLVLALHGPWGSGKSTVLGYVRHYLNNNEPGDRVIVDFNPWWFAGRDDLAQAFLRQLQAVLPEKHEKLKEVGSLIGDFAESIGGLVDLVAPTGGAGAIAGKAVATVLGRRPKDVPALKAKIAAVLREAEVPVLVMVDDIDRLDDSEVRQLFTVIKALADFPFVTYLLAFDREVASKAIEAASHLPGDRYLEKIIQVPFHLPVVDRVALRVALSKRLDEILVGTPDYAFDHGHWANVFMDGLDPLIQVPRDIVRLTNTLSVTYPAVLGEVNAVDFIAIEAVRVFLPDLYDTIRGNPDRFAGHSPDRQDNSDREAAKAFHEKWAAAIPNEWRPNARALMERLFPKTGRTGYGVDWLTEWRRSLRICHPDVFPVYFRLSLPTGAASRAEIMALVASVSTPHQFKERLLVAKAQKRLDGLSKARELLERLMDHVEKDIPDAQVPATIEALLDVGDDLLDPAEERGMFELGNDTRVAMPVYHLLKRVEPARRRDVLGSAIRASRGIAVQVRLLRSLDREASKPEIARGEPLVELADAKLLESDWLERVRVAQEKDLLANPNLKWILAACLAWGGEAETRDLCARLVETDAGLLQFLKAFLQHHKSHGLTDRSFKVTPRLNPNWLTPYLDTESVARRLMSLRERDAVPEQAKEAATRFLKELEVIASGKDPDALGWPDDE